MAGGWIGVITQELTERGVETARADAFACEYVIHQPYELQGAPGQLGRRLRDLGLEDEAADQAAAMLVAVSLFHTRRNLGDVGRLLRTAGVNQCTSRGAALEAARIRREILDTQEKERPALEVLLEKVTPALVFTGFAAILFVVAGRLG